MELGNVDARRVRLEFHSRDVSQTRAADYHGERSTHYPVTRAQARDVEATTTTPAGTIDPENGGSDECLTAGDHDDRVAANLGIGSDTNGCGNLICCREEVTYRKGRIQHCRLRVSAHVELDVAHMS